MKTHPTGNGLARMIGLVLCLGLVLMLVGCDYARMNEDEAVEEYKMEKPIMPAQSVPVTGGVNAVKAADPDNLLNPTAMTAENISTGRQKYQYYCLVCHGVTGDGQGTVGQSFAPLPTNLASSRVRAESDGLLFARIRLGFRKHPPLAYTVAEEDTWLIINYLRSLAPAGDDAS